MSEWKEVQLGKIATIIDSRHKTPKYSNEGLPMVRAVDIKGGKLNLDDALRVSQEVYDDFSKGREPQIGDLIISRVGHYLGRISYVDDNSRFCLGQNIAFIIPDKHWKFLYYQLVSPGLKYQIKNLSVGAAQPTLSLQSIKELYITLPSKEEQEFIGGLLGNIDKKITLLRQQNQDLEELAQTLFKRWFVEFEFPNENGEPYKSSGGKMVESELGEIPEGWCISRLQEITTLVSRGISPKYLEEGGICVLNQKCIRNKSIDFSISRRHNNELKNAKTKFIQLYDVLVNSTGVGTLGRTAVVKRLEEEPTTVDSHVSIIRANEEKVNKYFLSCFITGKEREIEHMAEGSTGQTELSRAKLNEMEVLMPSESLQIKFGKMYFSYSQKISSNEEEIQTLTELRDTLIPKLMSGELKIKK